MTASQEKRVLIVENDSVVASRIGETLESLGFNFSFATTASEARLC